MPSKLPSITFITCTLNSQSTIKTCLNSIKQQNYPKQLIKVLIIDGGSTDKTLQIVKDYPFCKIISENSGRPETATAIGYNAVKSDLIVNFSSDNVIIDKFWLKKMIKPLMESDKITACETLHYARVKTDTILNRYFALFGVNDPLAYYLGKKDRAAYHDKKWHLNIPTKKSRGYFVVKFDKDNLPTLGGNGFVIRTKTAQMVTKEPKKFFHIDGCYDLINLGFDTFAFVKTNVWHKSGESIISFIKRRIRYGHIYFQDKPLRRYHLFDPKKDKLRLLMFIFFSLTFLEPLYQAIKGYLKVKDKAWFLHPIICFLTVWIYGYTLISYQFKRLL